MATTQNGIFGRSSGSIGNVVTTTWKGLNVIKAKPMYVKRQFSQAELLNQAKIRTVSQAVSKIRQFAKYIFNFGTQGTTAFAELQKFFRNRITYELLLDATMFTNAKIGSSNNSISNFPIGTFSYNNFSLNLTNLIGSSDIIKPDTKFSIFMITQNLSKVLFVKDICHLSDDYLSISPSDYGFVAGDMILYAIKATREIPGELFTSELTFSENVDFTELDF